MVFTSRNLAASALTAVALTVAVAAPLNTASAHERCFGLAAGLIGGIAAGALIASAANAHPYYSEGYVAAPAPVYVPAPAYAPVYADEDGDGYGYGRHCWVEQEREWGPRHEFIGWRPHRICR